VDDDVTPDPNFNFSFSIWESKDWCGLLLKVVFEVVFEVVLSLE
jgi:hypothetical protein